MSDRYTIGEVLWLLHMERCDAIDADAAQPDSLANLSDTPDGAGTSAESAVMVIARWWDVQRAATAVSADKLAAKITELRAQGYSEEEVGKITGLSQATVHRRFRARLIEIVDALGGLDVPEERLSQVSACMRCGVGPRVRLAARKRKVKGGWRTLEPERQASLCVECLPPDLVPRVIVMARAVAA